MIYKVPFFENETLEDCLQCLYAMLKVRKCYYPELIIYNSHPVQVDQNHIFPLDLFAMVLTNMSTPYETFKQTYMLHQAGAHAIVALDAKDESRVGITLFRPEICEEIFGRTHGLVLQTYTEIDEPIINGFIDDLKAAYYEMSGKE